VDYYSVEEETPVASYNDFDHIVSLNESNQYTEGYNAITVGGKDSDISPQIQHEVLEDDADVDLDDEEEEDEDDEDDEDDDDRRGNV